MKSHIFPAKTENTRTAPVLCNLSQNHGSTTGSGPVHTLFDDAHAVAAVAVEAQVAVVGALSRLALHVGEVGAAPRAVAAVLALGLDLDALAVAVLAALAAQVLAAEVAHLHTPCDIITHGISIQSNVSL